ncbi:histidinol dehydrogenase [Mycobacterium aquaticum]|uniref:Histidinol dehydrogenase n=1 Tax=Mycobacterium aquaticum TaxID=1927124 RepID=A0A1X0AT96_9MYCO|nr:histidinol dehydrogenase [Mycobacterium aquaticum]ORA32896.1 histidinol dehydrogenase [Mycobacterium aquaticum]
MSTDRPILERGLWQEMSAADRADLNDRGSAKIFDPALREGVLEIIEDVRQNGDAGLVRALEKWDKISITPDRIRVSAEEFAAAREKVSPELLTAIRDLLAHLKSFNEQLTQHGDWSFESEPGLTVGEKVTPIASAGLFVPSGKGSYPSVMAQLGSPAVVAGVQQIAVVVPPIPGGDGEVDPAVLVVADELGIHDVFRANGPAGIAALAFGTETVPQVRKVCGPGSPPVTCAQVEVQRYGTVSVMLLGPSESLILADDSADPYLLAADLLNEAEHGPDSTSVFVTDSQALIDAVQVEVAKQLLDLPADRAEYARLALGKNGGAVLTTSVEESAEVANTFAPEHMQIAVRDEDHVLNLIVDAGEVLIGQHTTVSMANFVIGCPAALPTSGYAKVSSGVTADAFRKRTAVAKSTPQALNRMSSTVIAFTQHEGFPAHEFAVTRRLEQR